MPDVTITIGGRNFDVACQEGEEHFLRSAAKMLDAEAQVLVSQIGNLTEARLLLMAGLMLADKTAGMEDNLRIAEGKMGEMQAEMERLREAGGGVPEAVLETLEEIARESEKVAARVDALAEG